MCFPSAAAGGTWPLYNTRKEGEAAWDLEGVLSTAVSRILWTRTEGKAFLVVPLREAPLEPELWMQIQSKATIRTCLMGEGVRTCRRRCGQSRGALYKISSNNSPESGQPPD